MAIILQFRREGTGINQADRPQAGPYGQIIIFPGVRIERRPEPNQSSGETRTTARRAQRSRKK